MSCPPRINFIREVLIISRMINYCKISLYYIFIISFFRACFRFNLFRFTQHGHFLNLYCFIIGFVREYLLLLVHLCPIFLLSIRVDSLI